MITDPCNTTTGSGGITQNPISTIYNMGEGGDSFSSDSSMFYVQKNGGGPFLFYLNATYYRAHNCSPWRANDFGNDSPAPTRRETILVSVRLRKAVGTALFAKGGAGFPMSPLLQPDLPERTATWSSRLRLGAAPRCAAGGTSQRERERSLARPPGGGACCAPRAFVKMVVVGFVDFITSPAILNCVKSDSRS